MIINRQIPSDAVVTLRGHTIFEHIYNIIIRKNGITTQKPSLLFRLVSFVFTRPLLLKIASLKTVLTGNTRKLYVLWFIIHSS